MITYLAYAGKQRKSFISLLISSLLRLFSNNDLDT